MYDKTNETKSETEFRSDNIPGVGFSMGFTREDESNELRRIRVGPVLVRTIRLSFRRNRIMVASSLGFRKDHDRRPHS